MSWNQAHLYVSLSLPPGGRVCPSPCRQRHGSFPVSLMEEQWTRPHRVLARRFVPMPKQVGDLTHMQFQYVQSSVAFC